MEFTMETRYRGMSRQSEEISGLSDFELPSSSYDRRSRKGQKFREPPELSSLLLVIGFIVAVFAFVRYVDFRLPTPLTTADIADNPKSFIEERARNDLITLTSMGPRPSGSHANDIVAVDVILRILKDIQRTKFAVHNLEFEVQKPTGAFFMGFQDGLTSSYTNIPNIVVKLQPAGGKVNSSILVNCHFDTVPSSPGASDDMISCAVMLESLRVLTRQSKPLRNAIVFLFNGAEENAMQGSHGFIKGVEVSDEVGHKWATNLKTFINLEAAGAGGREILFQTGPGNGWLLDSYRTVPYPWGSVVGEEIFQKGLIPSDTDFRIFRDFAKIPGLDFAFIKNGFVYHTKFDNVDSITPGSIQHEGSNILALIEHLGNLDFSQIEYTNTNMVFFDVFGYFMIIYSETTAIVLNLFVATVTIAIMVKEAEGNAKTLLLHVFSTFGAWIAGIATAAFVGFLLNVIGFCTPFYSYPMSVFLIFGIPCLVGQILVYSYALKGSEDNAWMAGKLTIAVVLLTSTFFTRIVFSVTVNLMFGVVGWYTARRLFQGYRNRLVFYLLVGEAFPLALSLYLVSGCIDTFVPIMGRAGSEANPNLFVAVLTSFTLTLPTFTGIVPVFLFFKRIFLRGSAVFMVVALVVIAFVIGRIPYGDKTPMRLHIIEVDRNHFEADLTTIGKQDAGYWFFNVDPNIPALYEDFGENIPQLQNREEVDAYHCDTLYCGLPFYFPVKKLIRRSQWVPKAKGLPETIKERVRMDVTEDSFISPNVRRITLSFVGSDHLTINFSPGENYDLTNWSLTKQVPPPMGVLWKERPTYFLFHARGVNFQRFNVTMDFTRKTDSVKGSTGPLVDITFASFYLSGDDMKSQDMKDLVRKLPSWTYALGWSAVSHVYSIPGYDIDMTHFAYDISEHTFITVCQKYKNSPYNDVMRTSFLVKYLNYDKDVLRLYFHSYKKIKSVVSNKRTYVAN